MFGHKSGCRRSQNMCWGFVQPTQGSPTGIERSPVVANISWISNTYASHLASSAVFHMFFFAFFGIFSVFLNKHHQRDMSMLMFGWWFGLVVQPMPNHSPTTEFMTLLTCFLLPIHTMKCELSYLHGLEPCLNTLNPVDSED